MRPLVLHIDADRCYHEAVREAFAASAPGTDLLPAADGNDALDVLWRRIDDARLALPSLILVDLDLPRMTGWEVLAYLAADPVLRRIPGIVLTGLDGEAERCRGLGAVDCIAKPPPGALLIDLVRRLRPWIWDPVSARPEPLAGPGTSRSVLRLA